MSTRVYLDGKEFRDQVYEGIFELAQICQVTLGPGGRAILLENDKGGVIATKDGITVAQHYQASGPIQSLVAKAAIEASFRTVQSCGDGTTTSLVLAASIVEAGQFWLQSNPNYSPQRLARELKESFNNNIMPMIESLSRPLKNLDFEEAKKAIWHVAMVSANFDEEIANAVTEAVTLVGQDGSITCEEGQGGAGTTVSHQKGFPVNSGMADLGSAAGPAFVNRKSYGDTVLTGTYVTLYDGEINDIETILPLLERVSKETDGRGMPVRHPMVVVAHGYSDNVLKVFAQNFRQNILSIVPLKTPRNGQANGRQQFLYDLCAYTTGQVFDPQGNPLSNASPANIGFSEEVKITSGQTVFMTSPDEDAVSARIDELKTQLESANNEFDKDRIRYRIGQLTGGVSTIYAGGATAIEAKERRDRVHDAVSACRVASLDGIVPGGGGTLLHVARTLPNLGVSQIFVRALSRPFIQILLNAGVVPNESEAMALADSIGRHEDGSFHVYDALKRETVEWYSSGIFDPTAVTINALRNALSVAQLLMTTGGAIARNVSAKEQEARAMSEGFMKAMNRGDSE
jgi:chaperonin GroEL